jgi:transcriptional regulator with XRE-family HTH domain
MHFPKRARLRPWRRSYALKQKELASLLGIKSIGHVSRLERGGRVPSIEIAIACEILTGEPIKSLFSDTYAAVEQKTLARAQKLLKRIEDSQTPSSMRKKALIGDMMRRVQTGKHPNAHVEQIK